MEQGLELLREKLKNITIKKIPNTFLEIIGKSKDEVSISSFVAFLLNPQNTTSKIMELILEKTNDLEKDNENFIELFNEKDNDFESIEVEKWISNRSRVDILIKYTKFYVLIENKVDSQENGNQMSKYEEDLQDKNIPIKYICLKPNYNKFNFSNDRFIDFSYSDFIEILKQISLYDFEDTDNYIYLKEFVKHAEVYLMDDFEVKINDDVKMYIENYEKIEYLRKIYEKQNEIVVGILVGKIKDVLPDNYDIYLAEKYNFIQIWKKEWDNEGHNGVHFEFYIKNFKNILEKQKEVEFFIHNESKTKKIYTEIPKEKCMYSGKFDFDTEENISKSMETIVSEWKRCIKENENFIDEEIKKINNI